MNALRDSIRNFLTPPVFDDENKTHQAYLLHFILLALIFVQIPLGLFFVINRPEIRSQGLVQLLAGELINIIPFIMLKRGAVRQAAILQVGGNWVLNNLGAAVGSGVGGISYLLGNALTIVVAGALLGNRSALLVTLATIFSGGMLAYTEAIGVVALTNVDDPILTWILSTALFVIIAIMQRLSTHALRQALNRARTSEERYRIISRVSTDYIFETRVTEDGENQLVWVAGAFEEMTGYTYKEYMATGGWVAHVHPDDLEQDARDMEALNRNEDVKTIIRTFTKSGEVRWEHISAHPIWDEKKNRLAGIIGAVQDVTERKLADEFLRQTLLQQAAILNNIPDMAWLKDRDGHYIAVNEQFLNVAGKEMSQVIGKTDVEIWNDEFAKMYRDDDIFVMNTRMRRTVEEHQMDRSGRVYWVETTKTPIFNAHGEVVGTTGIARDIGSRKQAEFEREALIKELEAKNNELEQFTYTVSHDLKSPLVTIIGFLNYIEKDARSGEYDKMNRDIERIQQAVNKMQHLLKDLLELSRIGRMVNPPVAIPFTGIVKDALDILQGEIKACNAVIDLQPMDIVVRGDQIRLVEVMQNLISNAIKFMGSQPAPHVQIGCKTEADGEVVFFVRDNGIGISREYHEKIFGLFNKLSTETNGTGIGLTLVRRIIEVHGGRIWVESAPEQGTTFYFTLPLAK